MKRNIYVLEDQVAGASLDMMEAPNDETMIRSLEELLRNPAHTVTKHASSYALFHIGERDVVTKELEGCVPRYITHMSSLKMGVEEEVNYDEMVSLRQVVAGTKTAQEHAADFPPSERTVPLPRDFQSVTMEGSE